jgi:hypothetical protein
VGFGDTLSLDPAATGTPRAGRGERLQQRLDAATDRISPIVVKEVRQIVRGREFNYSFLASLAIGLLIAFFGAAGASSATGTAGQSVFSALMGALVLLGLAVVPIGAFSALRHERLEQTMDLITVTSLTARQIVVGKLLAQAVKLATLFAGMAPFVATSFLLGGIDFLTIVVSLAAAFLASLWVCAAAILLSSLAKTRGMSTVFFIGAGFLLLVFLGGLQILAAIFLAFTRGGAGVAFAISPASFGGPGWWPLGILATLGVVTMANMVLLAENRLVSPVENRATALRVGFLVQFLAIVGLFHIVAWFGPTLTRPAAPMVALCLLHLAVVAAFTVTEDFGVSRRVQRQMRTAWWRPVGGLLWPGAGRGAAYVLAQMALLLLATWPLARQPSDLRWVLAGCGYICCFSGVPAAAMRFLRPGMPTHLVRIAILLLLAASMVLPDLLYFLFARPDRVDLAFSARHVFNPLRALMNWGALERAGLFGVPLVLGTTGLLSYVALMLMQRRATGDDRTH